MGVAVVTDSTACLPPDRVAPLLTPFVIVPLGVSIDGETFTEGVDIDSEAVARAQKDGRVVTTSRPAPAALLAAYEQAYEDGATSVVSVHCSSALSSTVSSAKLAAAESSIPVTVIDSRTLGMAMGFAALAGARCADGGGDTDAVAGVIRDVADSSVTTFYVDSLEPLKRGGRIGRASALLGSALLIKPLLTVREGEIEPLERVRTTSRAMTRLVRRTVDAVDARVTDEQVASVVAVHSLDRHDLAAQVTTDLEATLPEAVPPAWTVPLGAVVTAHVGAGTIATVVAFPPVV